MVSRLSTPFRIPGPALILLVAASLGLAPLARAGSNDQARLALHLMTPALKNACDRSGAAPPCAGVVTAGDLYPTTYYAYLLVMNADPVEGIAALQCGLQYDGAAHQGVDIFSWVNCAALDFAMPGWPAAGTGNLLTWDYLVDCQRAEPGGPGTGVVATAGYFYLAAYSPDILRLTPRPVDALAKVAACSSMEHNLEGPGIHHEPSFLGAAAFSAGATTPGYNPCPNGAPPVDCWFTGPSPVDAGTTNIYSVTTIPPGATFDWSIGGDGTIVGSTHAPSVSVLAGTGGHYTLGVTVSVAGVSSTCSHDVRINPTFLTARIIGADSVMEGTQNHGYAIVASRPRETLNFDWTISGNGTINGTHSSWYVDITAGDPGAYHLACSVWTTGEAPTVVTKTVTVTPLTCGIYGLDPAPWPTPGIYYSANPPGVFDHPLPLTTYEWTITGNATIVSHVTPAAIVVETGALGAFELGLTITRNGIAHHCTRTITVVPPSTHPNGDAKLVLHLAPPSGHDVCGPPGQTPCAQVVTAGALYPATYYAYLLLHEGDALTGVQAFACGIDYDGAGHSGVDIFSWTRCCSFDASQLGPNGPWPAPGSGNELIWDSSLCQRNEPGGVGTGVVATGGYFYLTAYTPDRLKLVPTPVEHRAIVVDCQQVFYDIAGPNQPPGRPSQLGFANFTAGGTVPGYNPCGGIIVPVRVTTWSAIKALYGTAGPAKKP